MIPLSDPKWSQFPANYTNGAHVAQLLDRAGSEDPDAWYEDLFQEICHQYTVSSAAIPAAPYLVRLAVSRPDVRSDLLILLGSCYANVDPSIMATIPAEVVEDWNRSATEALPLITGLLEHKLQDPCEFRYLLSALAAVSGCSGLARAIEALDADPDYDPEAD